MTTKKEISHIKNISPRLNDRKAITLISLMKNGRISDTELMVHLGLKSANSASYYRKDLEKQGIIEGYTTSVNWTKIGYPTDFVILIEGGSMEANFNIEKEIITSLEDYAKKKGDILILPSGNGRVLIKNITTCFGERPMTIIQGHASSEHDALIYFRYYVAEKFQNAKTTFLLVKGKSIDNHFIKKDYINFMKGSFTEEDTLELPEEFKKHFPSLAAKPKK
jgi:DNA-binding Lrp family transcriptional regulator